MTQGPFTLNGTLLTVNVLITGMLAISYFQPPRGWVGGIGMQLVSWFALAANVLLLLYNLSQWLGVEL